MWLGIFSTSWQAAWGVTEFTLYYGLNDRPAKVQRAYGDYVGRLNAVLKPARRVGDVLLYYCAGRRLYLGDEAIVDTRNALGKQGKLSPKVVRL